MLNKLYRISAIIAAILLLTLMLLGGSEYALAALAAGGLVYLIGFGYKAISSISISYINLVAAWSISTLAFVGVLIKIGMV